MSIKINKLFITLGIIFAAVLTGCTKEEDPPRRTGSSVVTEAESETVRALGVINYLDTDNRNLSFRRVDNDAEFLYPYNNATQFMNKSGKAVSAAQFKPGDVVDIYYDSAGLNITRLQISTNKSVWENGKVTSFSVDENTNSLRIGQTMYFYTDGIGVYSDGEEIDIMQLNNSMDQLVVRGYDSQVVSIVVEKGHGYVMLTGDTLFIGGLVNISGILVRNIEKDMLLTVTEGEYRLEVINGEYRSEKNITVTRDKKTVVDFSDVQANVVETGNVKFSIDADNPVLYIDGTVYNPAEIFTLKTGKHNIKVTASGYKDYETEIDVKSGYEIITVSMAEGESSTEVPKTEADTTAVEGDTYVSKINDVTVEGPVGGLVYFDGTYMGIAPVTFDMITGTHVISILSQNKINSYSVNLVEGADNVTYNFSDD